MPPDPEQSACTEKLSEHWQRLAIFVWTTIVLLVCVRGLLHARSNTVYPIFADAARDFVAGADLYRGRHSPYRYSPLVAALLIPFSLFPDSLGGLLWRLLNAGIYLAAFAWWCRVVLPSALTASQQALLYLLIVPLSVGSLNNAQSNPLVLGLLLAGVAAVAQQRWNLASGCLALACLFKIYPLAVGLLLAALYPRRLGGRFLLAVLIGLMVPFFLRPAPYVLEQYAGWFHHLQLDDRQQLPVALWYRDVRLLLHSCQIRLSPRSYAVVQLVTAAGAAGFCSAGRLAGWEERRLLSCLFGLGCCWMTLFGSATESCTYILLAPILAWTLLDAWLRPSPWWLWTLLSASFGLFVVTQAAVWFPGGGRLFRALGSHPLAGLLLLIGVVGRELSLGLTKRGEHGCLP
jgi:hypothetical protein